MLNNPWFRLNLQIWALTVESAIVIALRMQKIAWGGYAAQRETYRMFSEKALAGQAVGAIMLRDGPNVTAAKLSKAVRHYDRKVSANKRRLIK